MSDTNDLMKQVHELEKFKAPPSLQEKLLAIPELHAKPANFNKQFRRIAPFGLAAAAVILLYTNVPHDDEEPMDTSYSYEEIETARQELAMAFHYLTDVSQQAGADVNHLIADSGKQALIKGVFYPILDEKKELNIKSGETK